MPVRAFRRPLRRSTFPRRDGRSAAWRYARPSRPSAPREAVFPARSRTRTRESTASARSPRAPSADSPPPSAASTAREAGQCLRGNSRGDSTIPPAATCTTSPLAALPPATASSRSAPILETGKRGNMLELFDAPVARDEQNVRVFGPRIDAGNRGMRLGKRGRLAIIRGIGEGFGGGGERESVLGGRGKRGEIGMRVGELGGKRRLGVEEDARGGMAGRLLGAEVGVDALGVLRRAQRAGRRE